MLKEAGYNDAWALYCGGAPVVNEEGDLEKVAFLGAAFRGLGAGLKFLRGARNVGKTTGLGLRSGFRQVGGMKGLRGAMTTGSNRVKQRAAQQAAQASKPRVLPGGKARPTAQPTTPATKPGGPAAKPEEKGMFGGIADWVKKSPLNNPVTRTGYDFGKGALTLTGTTNGKRGIAQTAGQVYGIGTMASGLLPDSGGPQQGMGAMPGPHQPVNRMYNYGQMGMNRGFGLY